VLARRGERRWWKVEGDDQDGEALADRGVLQVLRGGRWLRFTLLRPRVTHPSLTPDAIQDLYRSHAFAVFRRCQQLLGRKEDADDAVHEVFVRVLEQPARFQARSSPATFLYALATHVCLNRLRSNAARGVAWPRRGGFVGLW
jgi:hypothetical protein